MKQTRYLMMVILAITLSAYSAGAQKLRLNAYATYIFQDQIDSYYDASNYYQGQINDGFQWGAGLEFMASPQLGVELQYLRMDTKAPLRTASSPNKAIDYDLAINYILLNGTQYIRKAGSKVEGFGGLGLGVGIFDAKNPSNGKSETLTKFSWQLRLGGIIWASEKVGIKLQGTLQSAVQAMGGGFYFGTGGTGAGVSSYSTIYQFGLGGGLVIPFGNKGGTAH